MLRTNDSILSIDSANIWDSIGLAEIAAWHMVEDRHRNGKYKCVGICICPYTYMHEYISIEVFLKG